LTYEFDVSLPALMLLLGIVVNKFSQKQKNRIQQGQHGEEEEMTYV
jgi:hypothetical protein